MPPTCAAWSDSSSRATTPASRPTMRASSSTPGRSRATRASSPRASSFRCCTGCGATCSSGCGARDTTCACTSRSAPSGIPISCAGSPSGRRTSHSSSATCCGSDGQSYSVGTYVDDGPDAQGRYGAALLFVRWSDAGDRPVGHLETDYLSRGATPADALSPLLALTLQEVKQHLDACIQAQGRV